MVWIGRQEGNGPKLRPKEGNMGRVCVKRENVENSVKKRVRM